MKTIQQKNNVKINRQLTCPAGDAISWYDTHIIEKGKILNTEQEMHIPGLRLFGWLQPFKAEKPMVRHYHENAFEITFIVQGEMSFSVDNNHYMIPGGSVFISYPNEPHSINDLPWTPLQIYWIQLDISDPEHFLFLQPKAAEEVIENLYCIRKHIIETDNREICKIMKNAFSICTNTERALETSCYLTIFLQRIIQYAKREKQASAPDIDAAVSYINSHLKEELHLADLAQISCLSLPQFQTKFRNYTGSTPRNYINSKKIEYSKHMLKDGFSITDTAMSLGFNSSTYFSTVFKKYAFLTPSEYTAKYLAGDLNQE